MKTCLKTVCYLLFLFNLMIVNAQETNDRTALSKLTFEELMTSESSLKWMKLKDTERIPKALFLEKSKLIYDLDEHSDFKLVRANPSKNNLKHYRFQQFYKGIAIEGAEYLLHEKNGLIETANGNVISGMDINTNPSLSEQVALKNLLQEINAEKYAWEDAFWEQILKDQLEDEDATHFPKAILKIIPPDEDMSRNDFQLAYVFDVHSIEPFENYKYFVNAHSGEIIDKVTLLCENDVQGTCTTHSYGQQTITTHFTGSNYHLKEAGRNIETRDAEEMSDNSSTPYADANNVWTSPEDISGCEAHWAAEQTYDYFLSDHNLLGYDGWGQKLMIWANWGTNEVNAFANAGKIHLGNGNGTTFGPLTSLDIVAHEYAHLVNEAVGPNLRYRKESGALNESLADIIGTAVEYKKHNGSFDWLLGEDASLTGSAFRSMSNPNAYGQPDTYEGTNWYSVDGCTPGPLNDQCGVHTNSGVLNYWFYLLCEGGSGTNDNGQSYNVTGLGIDRSTELVYEFWINYLSLYSGYADAYQASLDAANALSFTSVEIQRIENAWCAVGVGSCGALDGTITLTSPNGGENFEGGLNQTINWFSTGNIGNSVKLEYSTNGGVNWISIDDYVPSSNNSYAWTVPNLSTELALIRISANDDNTIFDNSNNHFIINSCPVNARFSTVQNQFCRNDNVVFTNESTSNSGLSFQWKINGSLYSSNPNFSYSFPVSGNYQVELTAFDGVNDCADSYTKTIFIENYVSPTFDVTIDGMTVSCVSSAQNSNSAIFNWTFGGNGESYGTDNMPNCMFTYSTSGEYSICLVVSDNCAPVASQSCYYVTVDSSNPNCLENDSLALVALYNATDGPNWSSPWDLNQPVNTWDGVHLTNDGCNVLKLYSNNNNLNGSIPPELGDLQNLTTLNLQGNNLSGSIPPEFGNLQNLTFLFIGGNNLSGPIPSELSSLRNLENLSIGGNNLTGSIPPEFGSLLNLESLSSGENNLSGPIPPELGSLPNLRTVSLSGNNLSGSIPPELGNLPSLLYIALIDNNLSGSIPSEFGNIQSLEYLYLGKNNLSGSVPSELGNLQNLWLYLNENNLSGCYSPNLCNMNTFVCYDNPSLPDGGSAQGFADFCAGNGPCANSPDTNVYPGDLNYDGIVDYRDLLPFGDFYGTNGTVRDEQGIDWNPYLSLDWGIQQDNLHDIKHVDADGNGFIDLTDAGVIQINYGLTHNEGSTGPPNNLDESPIIIDLQPAIMPSFSANNDQLIMDIVLQDTVGNDVGVYGGYFSIYYDEVQSLIQDIDVNITTSWLGDTGSNLKSIVKHDPANNKFDISFTRIDHSNSIGEGSIGNLIATVNNDTPWDSISFIFDVTDIAMHNSESYDISVVPNSASTAFTIYENNCYPQHNLTPSAELNTTYYAQNQIQTLGNVIVENVDITQFRGNELRLNTDFEVEPGGRLSFYNDPCGISNRGVNTSRNLKGDFGKMSYAFSQESGLNIDLNLKNKGNVSLEILGNVDSGNGLEKLSTHNFGLKQVGKNEIHVPKSQLPGGDFLMCVKVGFDRYYFTK